MTAPRILVVDDEPAITEFLTLALSAEGFNVATAGSGRAALAAVADFHPDLLTLDIGLPDMDGFAVLEQVLDRAEHVPVIFLSARAGIDEKLAGLEAGADDYLTKPFSLDELVARIRAVLRGHEPTPVVRRLAVAGVELNENTHEVWRGSELVEMTRTEFRLLSYLAVNAGHVVTRRQLIQNGWDHDLGVDEDSVLEMYMWYLRRKVDLGEQPLIEPVPGVGYVAHTIPSQL